MVGLFQHLGRSVQNRPHFFIALIFGVFVASLLAWLTSWKWSTILLASGMAQSVYFTPCLETDEKCRPFTNATASQKTGRK